MVLPQIQNEIKKKKNKSINNVNKFWNKINKLKNKLYKLKNKLNKVTLIEPKSYKKSWPKDLNP